MKFFTALTLILLSTFSFAESYHSKTCQMIGMGLYIENTIDADLSSNVLSIQRKYIVEKNGTILKTHSYEYNIVDRLENSKAFDLSSVKDKSKLYILNIAELDQNDTKPFEIVFGKAKISTMKIGDFNIPALFESDILLDQGIEMIGLDTACP